MAPTPPSAALAALFHTPRDAVRLQRHSLLALGLLYVHFALVAASWIAGWTLLLSAPVLVVRWMLATHELFHIRDEREVHALTRLMLLLLTPLSIGYREHLAMHRGHHRWMATPEDPEYFQLRGNKVAGFLNALTAPEQSFFRWVAAHGLDRALMVDGAVRLTLFAALAWATGWTFLWCWVPVRLSHGLAFFSFFYLLHRRGAEFGVYGVSLPRWAARVFIVLFGREVLLATCHHDVHHRHPRVSAFHLPELRESAAIYASPLSQ